VARLLAQGGLAPGGYFHAHVTSRWMFKALPHAKAARLLDRLQAPCCDLSGSLSLKQLGALSAGARFFAGVDSAPMHMAAALDVPVLGVFGPSSVPDWGPWDNGAGTNPYRRPNGVQVSGRHLVLQAERSCVPCLKDGCNGSKVSDCLDFQEQELEQALRRFVAGLDPSRGGSAH
jgi:ADP-heptose:LPS heptosyltransferase